MYNQVKIRQIDTARRHVGGNANAGPPVAQGLQRLVPFVLAQFTGQGDSRKPAFKQNGVQMANRLAGIAENQGRGRFDETQHIDHRMLNLVGGDEGGAVLDIGMSLLTGRYGDAPGIVLVLLGQGDDSLRQCCRKQQRPSLLRRRLKNELEILAKAKVKHLVGFVEDHGFQIGDPQAAPLQMVAQAAGGSDDDMRPLGQSPLLGPRIHPADASNHLPSGILVEPGQFAMHLQRQLAGWGDDKCQRFGRRLQGKGVAQQGTGNGQAVGDCLARAGLRRHQQIAVGRRGIQHRRLNLGRIGEIALGQSPGKRMIGRKEDHV